MTPNSSLPEPIARALIRIVAEPRSESPEAITALVAALRPPDAGDNASARASVLALAAHLEATPDHAAALRVHLLHQFSRRSQAETFSDLGIPPNTGFFSELRRRLAEKVLPPLHDPASLRGLIAEAFPRSTDQDWVRGAGADAWIAVARSLARGGNASDGKPVVDAVLTAVRTVSHRVAALGLEPELAAISEDIRRYESPFVAQNVEIHRLLDNLRSEDFPPEARIRDVRQILVLLDQCRAVIARIRRNTGHTGISVALTYRLQRLTDNLRRLQDLLALISPENVDARIQATVRLLGDFVEAHCSENELGAHLSRHTELLAREITEHSGRTGEHYITASRGEYGAMFRAALGAGAIVPILAFVKLWLHGIHAPPLVEGLLYSLNYVVGFVLIHLLHFTLATKQPAMTATRIAAALSAPDGAKPDPRELANLLIRVCRSQFIAVVGNVAFAFPLAMIASAAWFGIFGEPAADAAKAEKLLVDTHPGLSLAVWYAAIAGVYLFLAGIVSGYYDNMAVYRRIPERVARLGWLRRLLGTARAERVGSYLAHNLGGITGNVFFGFMLGITSTIGFNLGLPLDIRHVTFSAANVAMGWFTLGDGVALPLLLWALVGVLLIGVTNLFVSFGLALYLAMRARRVPVVYLARVVPPLLSALRSRPLDFVRPPRGG